MLPVVSFRSAVRVVVPLTAKSSSSVCTRICENTTIVYEYQHRPRSISYVSLRSYHASSLVAAKPTKKGKGGKGKPIIEDDEDEDDDNDDNDKNHKNDKKSNQEVPEIKLPDLKALDSQMDKKLERMSFEFTKLRTGQANTELFKTVMVDAHGARIPVSEAGQISVKSPTKISISVFDPALISNVANAIRDCGMSLNPTIEGNNIAVAVPKPSKETRDALVKTASRIAEKVSTLLFIFFSFIISDDNSVIPCFFDNNRQNRTYDK